MAQPLAIISRTDLAAEHAASIQITNHKEPAMNSSRLHSAGVGDARVRGAEVDHHDRSFVSQSVDGRGKGSHELEVEVGVGDIDVKPDD